MAYRDKYNLEPLRIRAYLRSGVVCDKQMPLDGVLLYQAHRWLMGPPDATLPGDYTNQGVATLPLGINNPGQKTWYYQCSWAQWSSNAEGKDHWAKRFDARFADFVNFQGKRGNIVVKSGKYKAYRMPVFYRVAEWVEWYATGDKAEIEALLSTVTNIGKKCVQGWGRVSRWLIEPTLEDWSVWNGGRLMRGIPVEDAPPGLPYRAGLYGIRPSYWKRSNQRQLVMPI